MIYSSILYLRILNIWYLRILFINSTSLIYVALFSCILRYLVLRAHIWFNWIYSNTESLNWELSPRDLHFSGSWTRGQEWPGIILATFRSFGLWPNSRVWFVCYVSDLVIYLLPEALEALAPIITLICVSDLPLYIFILSISPSQLVCLCA